MPIAAYAAAAAEIFLDRLFQHGTTSALAFCSVHKTCADALFAAAETRGMALVTGKTMMDRNAIPAVQDDPETGARETEELYDAWHGKGRLRYAVTPRFAITSSEAQLKLSGELLASLARRADADASVRKPGRDRLRASSCSPMRRTIPTSMITSACWATAASSPMASTCRSANARGSRSRVRRSCIAPPPTPSSAPASCPCRICARRSGPVHLGVATDVGGGTSYSMLATLGETYKVQMLAGYKPTAIELFAMATRGNAGAPEDRA